MYLNNSIPEERKNVLLSDMITNIIARNSIPEERKNVLLSDMITNIIARYGDSDEKLYHQLCDILRMTKIELHQFSVTSLDDFIDTLHSKARKNFDDIKELFCNHNRMNLDLPEKERTALEARVVATAANFSGPYSLEARTYMYTSDNKAFKPDMNGNSIFATSVDLADKNIRLDWYSAWEIDGAFVVDVGGSLTEEEETFCMNRGIPVVRELNRACPQWPELFKTICSEEMPTAEDYTLVKKKPTKTLLETMIDAAEKLGWTVCSLNSDKEFIELEFSQGSDAGEDFSFFVRAKTPEGIAEEVSNYYELFDPEEHAMLWYGKEGAPGLRALLDDADSIENMLQELTKELGRVICEHS